ncbi:HEXXH motif-containing putative peptide modification protein [Streptomyces sp. 378]|uniref:aKG-HExxH-type peptide beta-hydroxylase n=1 Tax=Streptomyces sp. 378 TaxID=3049412 RepID=UPI0024C2B109|nr:HEXXH motif-containing putative peptide modification protein [Streptomyces sp. 378]MDK1348304.1 HEXXH motif-containing putative peptide modification protein [Streptomyces sp. 378]
MSALSPEALVALGSIADHQRLRTSRITSVLANRLGSSALDYAVAHHLLEGAEHAARARGADRLAWYRHTTVRDLTHLSAGAHIVLNPRTADMLRSEISETAYYLVNPDTSPAPPEALGLARAAIASATEHGFGTLLTQHAPVICLLNRRRLDETLHSWALTRLPGTVFTDYTAHPEVLARDLIHEAAHNWLNDALAAHDVRLPTDVTFFSPWRGTDRPVFGFLHACWAFALTVLYAREARRSATGAVAPFLDTHLRHQAVQFAAATEQMEQALSYVTAHEIRERIGRAVGKVVGPAGSEASPFCL